MRVIVNLIGYGFESLSMNRVRLIAVAGGSGSGKTTLAGEIVRNAGGDAALIALDWYYESRDSLSPEERSGINFDHPDALESDLLVRHLKNLKAGSRIDCPQYDFASHTRTHEPISISPVPLIVVEGVLCLHYPALRELFDFTIYVDTPDEVRLERRIRRDVAERGRTVESVLKQWNETVLPMHRRFVEVTRGYADMTVPGTKAWTPADPVMARSFSAENP